MVVDRGVTYLRLLRVDDKESLLSNLGGRNVGDARRSVMVPPLLSNDLDRG